MAELAGEDPVADLSREVAWRGFARGVFLLVGERFLDVSVSMEVAVEPARRDDVDLRGVAGVPAPPDPGDMFAIAAELAWSEMVRVWPKRRRLEDEGGVSAGRVRSVDE